MIRILKLQKAVIAFILGVVALVAYRIMSENKLESSRYLLTLSGILFIAGALMFLYPILSAKKVKEEDCVELDPEKQEEL
ncbi:MAG: isoleucyl-tRNA synthetase [Bacteroidota bacterium]